MTYGPENKDNSSYNDYYCFQEFTLESLYNGGFTQEIKSLDFNFFPFDDTIFINSFNGIGFKNVHNKLYKEWVAKRGSPISSKINYLVEKINKDGHGENRKIRLSPNGWISGPSKDHVYIGDKYFVFLEIKINNYWVFVFLIKITKKCEVLNDIPFNHYQYIVAGEYSFDFYLQT